MHSRVKETSVRHAIGPVTCHSDVRAMSDVLLRCVGGFLVIVAVLMSFSLATASDQLEEEKLWEAVWGCNPSYDGGRQIHPKSRISREEATRSIAYLACLERLVEIEEHYVGKLQSALGNSRPDDVLKWVERLELVNPEHRQVEEFRVRPEAGETVADTTDGPWVEVREVAEATAGKFRVLYNSY